MKKTFSIILLSLLIVFALSSCGISNSESLVTLTSEASAPEAGQSSSVEQPEPTEASSNVEIPSATENVENLESVARRISVQFGENMVVYELNDGTAADSLYEQLPLTIEVEDYSTNEKIFYPSQELDTSNSPLAQSGAGTLAYFEPWGDVVFFYGDYNQNPSLFELGQVLSGMGVQMLVAGMITFISLLGVAGDIEALETVVMIGVTLRFTTLLNDIASSLFGMEDRRQMLNSLDEVMGAPEMSVVAKTKGQPKNADITLNCVSFSYTKDKPVIQDISFTVPAHKMFAVVGPSGCGKTTIIKLIARFYDVDEGTIHIGNIALRDYTTEDLFRQISFVFQDVYLFNDSLKNNILIAKPDATDQELHAVADLAGVTEIVQRLPDGWDTICGEGGRSLSGGERQRVSIARALLKHAPIVLLDEATSALDAENEANIVRSIEVLRKNSTLVVVAHKLETIRMADEIMVLDQAGRITEAGSHEELLKQNGPYKEFWAKRSASAQWKLA